MNPRTSRALSQWREFPAGIQPTDAQQFKSLGKGVQGKSVEELDPGQGHG
jgi:hypothetical protein